MVNGIGSIPGIIVIIIIICIMNHYCCITIPAMITTMGIIIIMMINTNCHYCKCGEIRRRICGWIIGHIYR